MRIDIPIEPYLKKYLDVRHPVIKIQRSDFIGMLAYAHLKYRKPSPHQHLSSKLISKVSIEIPFSKWVRLSLYNDREWSYIGFNNCIHDFFFMEYYQYMDTELRFNELEQLLGKKKLKIVDLTKQFMALFDLSEEDISIETLLRNYRRRRMNT